MSIQQLSHLHHCAYSIQFHLVLVTKYRRKCINSQVLEQLNEVFTRLSDTWGGKLIEFNGEPDHVHLLVALNPSVQPSKFVNNIKTVSSRLLRRDHKIHLSRFYRKSVFWSRTYCLLSCGGAPLGVIKQYIEQQAGVE